MRISPQRLRYMTRSVDACDSGDEAETIRIARKSQPVHNLTVRQERGTQCWDISRAAHAFPIFNLVRAGCLCVACRMRVAAASVVRSDNLPSVTITESASRRFDNAGRRSHGLLVA